MGLPPRIWLPLSHANIETAGVAWKLFSDLSPEESREMTRAIGLSDRQAKAIERAIVRLRDEAGDPAPWSHLAGKGGWT